MTDMGDGFMLDLPAGANPNTLQFIADGGD